MASKNLYKLSPSLSHLLGKSELTRPAAIKEFWAYVKQHELQDPKNGRVVRPNQAMKDVFGVDQTGFTQVMGLLSKHLEKKFGQVICEMSQSKFVRDERPKSEAR